jgi:hypothetical protein
MSSPLFPWMIYESICSQSGTKFSGSLGGTLTSPGGATCTPITAFGTGSGGTCTQQPVCCTNNTQVSLHHALVHRRLAIRTDGMTTFSFPFSMQKGLVNISCVPVNTNT